MLDSGSELPPVASRTGIKGSQDDVVALLTQCYCLVILEDAPQRSLEARNPSRQNHDAHISHLRLTTTVPSTRSSSPRRSAPITTAGMMRHFIAVRITARHHPIGPRPSRRIITTRATIWPKEPPATAVNRTDSTKNTAIGIHIGQPPPRTTAGPKMALASTMEAPQSMTRAPTRLPQLASEPRLAAGSPIETPGAASVPLT